MMMNITIIAAALCLAAKGYTTNNPEEFEVLDKLNSRITPSLDIPLSPFKQGSAYDKYWQQKLTQHSNFYKQGNTIFQENTKQICSKNVSHKS